MMIVNEPEQLITKDSGRSCEFYLYSPKTKRCSIKKEGILKHVSSTKGYVCESADGKIYIVPPGCFKFTDRKKE